MNCVKFLSAMGIFLFLACQNGRGTFIPKENPSNATKSSAKCVLPAASAAGLKIATAALELTKQSVSYDPTYFSIPYPMGDVPANKGVCTDVVIRTYRKLNIDLQEKVHNDMQANFAKYPKIWGLSRTDKNIDHRRVPNLQVFFKKFGSVKVISDNAKDYAPGDIVTWKLPPSLPHVGIVSHIKNDDGSRYLIIHNVGAGQVSQDFLFSYPITGHYSFTAGL
jgi:uncharacterized protein YijF (DUF1287 family)